MRVAPIGVILILLTTFSLTACSAPAQSAAECKPLFEAGSVTEATKVSRTFGKSPVVKLPENTEISSSQRRVVSQTEETGTPAKIGDLVTLNYAVFDGETGKKLDETEFSKTKASAPLLVDKDFAFPGLYKSLVCAAPGERLLLAIAPKDGLGAAGADAWGLSPDATMIMVIDVLSTGEPRAEGQVQQLPSGFPNVVTTDTGQVGIVLPPSAPPTDVAVAERIRGEGAIVTPEDVVIAQSLSVNWDSRQLMASTWADGSPTSLGAEASGDPTRALLTGYPVGSQVVAIVPNPQGTVVYVIDIIGVG